MCGVTGIFDFSASPRADGSEFVIRATQAIAHRGPDDSGIYRSRDGRTILGHRRLSIVDLSSAGKQPMTNEDETVWLTFNGEIYNHEALRPGLIAKGHTFRSHSDTEAIIHLYEERGVDCVKNLDGMFAFALWDVTRSRLLLARDRLGKKPLYYTVVSGRLIFASEIKALVAHPDVRRELDLTALNQFLTFSNVPSPRTLFAGIHKLPPAHVLTCTSQGEIEVRRYWSALDREWNPAIDEREATEQVRERLFAAVKKRLMADVPIGCFLSGGLDSSTNVALMSRLMDRPLQTFSVGFTGFGPSQNFHDLPFAQLVADRFGCDHHEVQVTADDCKAYLPQLVVQQDEPIGDPACLPMHFVCKAAHEHGLKVVLVGEGSDEVFGGYDDMAKTLSQTLPRWRRLMRMPRIVRELAHQAARLSRAPPGRVDLLRRAARSEPLYWGLDVVFWETEKEHLLEHAARAQMGESPAAVIRTYLDELDAAHHDADGLQIMSYTELRNRLPELLLMRVDKISMAHSIEARAPFLDHELSAYALSLPAKLKINGGSTKVVLRDVARSFLPPEIIERPKQGFRVPLPEWLATDLSPWAEDVLHRSSLRKLGIFRFDEIERMWGEHRARRADHSFDLWCLLNLAVWHDHWIDGRAA